MKLLRPLRWLTAAATLLIAAWLCWQCVDIYLTGNAPANLDANGVHLQSVFRMEDVAARLNPLLWPLLAYAALIAATDLLHAVYAPGEKHPGMSAENRLRLMKARIAELPASAAAEEKQRRCIRAVAAAVILLCAIGCLMYLLNSSHFTSWDLETVMGSMMLHIAPWTAIAIAAAIVASGLCARSMEREISFLKGTPATHTPEKSTNEGKHVNMIRMILFAAAALLIVLGVMNGGLRDVLVKAINICTECIGLG